MKRVIKFIGNLLAYTLIIGGIIYGLPRFLVWSLDTSYPMAAITSGSMWPVLKEGDLVIIQGVSRNNLKVGDIIVYKNAGGPGFTIHRIMRLEENRLVTKGDANFTEDAPISYNQIIGKNLVIRSWQAHIPYLGNITQWVNEYRAKK